MWSPSDLLYNIIPYLTKVAVKNCTQNALFAHILLTFVAWFPFAQFLENLKGRIADQLDIGWSPEVVNSPIA